MVRKLGLFGVCAAALVAVSCLGTEPVKAVVSEADAGSTPKAACQDGVDNDGNGEYDCYDVSCRKADSVSRLSGDTICHYERYRMSWLATSSSSLSSSSSETSSSSGTTSAGSSTTGFPFAIADRTSDTIQIQALFHKDGSNEVAYAGRFTNKALYGVIDLSGTPVVDFQSYGDLSTPWSTSAFVRRFFVSLDTSLTGTYMASGAIVYADSSFATAYTANAGSGSGADYGLPIANFVYVGYNTATTQCYVGNDDTVGYVMVDKNLSDNISPSKINKLNGGQMVAGEIVGDKCVGLAVRKTYNPDHSIDSIQTWYLRTTKTNSVDTAVQVKTPISKLEDPYSMVTIGSTTFIAARIAGSVRMLILNPDLTVRDTGSVLAAGYPHRIRKVTVGGETRLAILGDQAGAGFIVLTDTAGAIKANPSGFSDVSAFSDIVQTSATTFLVSGWKNVNGGGSVAKILKLNDGLQIVP